MRAWQLGCDQTGGVSPAAVASDVEAFWAAEVAARSFSCLRSSRCTRIVPASASGLARMPPRTSSRLGSGRLPRAASRVGSSAGMRHGYRLAARLRPVSAEMATAL